MWLGIALATAARVHRSSGRASAIEANGRSTSAVDSPPSASATRKRTRASESAAAAITAVRNASFSANGASASATPCSRTRGLSSAKARAIVGGDNNFKLASTQSALARAAGSGSLVGDAFEG